MTVVCLSDKNCSKVPKAELKKTLLKAGRGCKRIQLSSDDNFMDKVCSDQKDESNECIGFPQLQHCGGFELLRCQSNSRCLTVIDCPLTVKYLKQFLGAQAKIYIRPVQQNLSTTPVGVETTESDHVKEACRNCGQMIPLQSLRSHYLECCEETQSSAYGEESFDFPFEINETPTQYSAPETSTQYSAPETPTQYSAPETSTQYSAPETSTQYSAPEEASLAVEVDNIVNASSGSGRSSRKKTNAEGRSRTWTVTVVCLSDKNCSKVHKAELKETLLKAGLGCKRIQLSSEDNFMDKVCPDQFLFYFY